MKNKKPRKYLNSPLPPPPPKMPIERAAMDNLTPEFFAVLTKLGFDLVIVRFDASPDSPVWKHLRVEDHLARQLMALMVGDHDSSTFSNGVHYHFFHVTNLAKGIQTLKDTIEAIGLLNVATILHAESAEELRMYYPPADPKDQVASV